MKVVGAAFQRWFGGFRVAYLPVLLTYLAAMLLVTIGYMVQDVVADALSVEIARNDEEIGQIQTLGRMATMAGGIAVGLPSGWLVAALGSRGVFTCAMALPILVALSV